MKVLCMIDSLGSGGAQRQIVTLARLLKDKGIDVSILVYHKADFFKTDLDTHCIPIELIESSNNLSRILKVRAFIRSKKFDAVISFLAVPNFLNCVSAIGKTRWKVITSERSSNEENFRSFKSKIFSWFQKYSNIIVCNSHNAQQLWLKYYPKYEKKIQVIYNPILLPDISSVYLPKKNNRLKIIIAASYRLVKNPLGLIKAISLLDINDRNKIEINWYGSDDGTGLYQECINLINHFELYSIIKLNGPTKNIGNLMKEADVVALFSKYEGLPNAICEGMMHSKPIIMSKVSDFRLLVDDSNGFLCSWDDIISIKEAILKAINLSTSELISMGVNSRIKAENMFSESEITNQWLDLLLK